MNRMFAFEQFTSLGGLLLHASGPGSLLFPSHQSWRAKPVNPCGCPKYKFTWVKIMYTSDKVGEILSLVNEDLGMKPS